MANTAKDAGLEVLISSDSHVMEPSEILVERVDQRFRDQAPRFPKLKVGESFQTHPGGSDPTCRIKEMETDGLLISDDTSMKALSGDFAARTDAILAAGCDVVLHCNGLMDEMRAVAKAAPALSGRALERAERALRGLASCDDAQETDVRAEFSAIFEAVV
jgi:hypothetical protein